jgi:hypothetical protein
VHWLEGLEPYEGKLSSTVLRGGRAGNSPLPLGPIKVRQKDAQPRQDLNTSQISATAAGISDFRISAFQFSAFSPDSSPIKPNQGGTEKI